ncbi:MAG: DUF1080 domain-containing protein [Bacteroidaceae bacterium]|nr:DUF1080 domain-containing protein [Bacteroidaceae bacterium]
MKKIFNILMLAVLMLTVTTTPAFAQDARQRTTETIVQDALALMPLQNQTDFNREMEDIAKAAPKSIEVLVGMMQPTEKAKNNLLEYAINGVTNFASAAANVKYKKAVLDGLQAAAPKAPDQYVRQFIQSQIRLLAGDEKPIEFCEHAGATPYAQAYDNLKKLGANAGPAIVKTLKSKDHALRMQALKFATANNLATDDLAKQVVGMYKKQNEEGKADIINWLGDNKIASQKAFLNKAIAQGGKPAAAAIEALGKIGGDDALTTLVAQLGGDNSQEAFNALLSFKGDISGKVTEALKTATGQQQNSLLSLASARRITSAAPIVFDLAKTNSAARSALAGVVGKDDISKVAQLLDAASGSDKADYQKALSASIKSMDAKQQYQTVSAEMKKATNKEYFYPILASTNTNESVEELQKIGSQAAINALLRSTNLKAAAPLLNAAKAGDNNALNGYINLMGNYQKNADSRYEGLNKAMQLAKSDDQKKVILDFLADTPTRNAFLLAGKYLDDNTLGYNAAVAEKDIINKTNEDIEYDVVKDNLTKAMALYKAHGTADDGYAVDELKKILSELQPSPIYVLSDEEKKQGFELLFDGTNLDNFVGNKVGYVPINGCINVTANYGNESNLYTKKEYRDFIFRFEFCFLRPGVNNGVGIRTPMGVDAAYYGMCECQILDHDDPIYAGLREYQVHGSVYGVIPAKRIKHKPLGEWSEEEIRVQGNHITVTVNGEVIVDGDIKEACQGHNVAPDGSDNNPYTVDHKNHPGMFNKTGHIGFLGHGAGLKFRNVRVLDLTKAPKGKKK